MKIRIMLAYALCILSPGCSLVTVPVKTAGKIVTTSVSTTGKVVAAPFNAMSGNKADKNDETDEKED